VNPKDSRGVKFNVRSAHEGESRRGWVSVCEPVSKDRRVVFRTLGQDIKNVLFKKEKKFRLCSGEVIENQVQND
jgi:hypothetical protein